MTHRANTSEPETDSDAELARAAQERVDKLMHDMKPNPAITCPISFNWQGNQQLADRASTRIRLFGLLMREEWPSISFTALRQIKFHHDYELALKEAVGTDRSAPTPTKEAGGF